MLHNKPRKHIGILLLCIIFFTFLIISLVKSENTKSIAPYKHYEENDPNVLFESRLRGQSLKFYTLKNEMDVYLHSIIVMPSIEQEGFLSIEFPRKMLTDKFIKDMFYEKNRNVLNIHPFSDNGIEPILTRDKLILNIHNGVILHLRNDMQFFPKYKTFKSERVAGRVTQVKGNIFYSSDHQVIRRKLSDVYVWWIGPGSETKHGSKLYKQPDGSYVVIMPFDKKTDIPPKYPPKILKD